MTKALGGRFYLCDLDIAKLSQGRMVRPMVKDHKTYPGVPGFIGAIPATPKGGVRLATGFGLRVMYTA